MLKLEINGHSLSAILATRYTFFFSVMPLEFSFYSKFHSLLFPLGFVKAIVGIWCSVFLADRRNLNLFSLLWWPQAWRFFGSFSQWQESRLEIGMSTEGEFYILFIRCHTTCFLFVFLPFYQKSEIMFWWSGKNLFNLVTSSIYSLGSFISSHKGREIFFWSIESEDGWVRLRRVEDIGALKGQKPLWEGQKCSFFANEKHCV